MSPITRALLFVAMSLFMSTLAASQIVLKVNLSSHPDPYLSNWQVRKTTVIVTIMNSGGPVEAKFDCTINLNGAVQAYTKPESMRSIIIPTGVSQYFGDELVPLEAMKINGSADKTAIKTGMLPAGYYDLCVGLLDPRTYAVITPQVCRSFMLQSYQAPVLMQPPDKSETGKGSRVMFRWTPVSPLPPTPVQYRLTVFEVLPGQTPVTAYRVNRAILDREVMGAHQLLWPPDVEAPVCGKMYVWSVQAKDVAGNFLGEHDGTATPFVFTACPAEKQHGRDTGDHAVLNVTPPHLARPASLEFFKATLSETAQERSYRLTISNSDSAIIVPSSVGDPPPVYIRIKVHADSIISIEGGVSKGWERTPSKIPPASSAATWTNSSGAIPFGETDLGVLTFASKASVPTTVNFEWLNKSAEVICSDSVILNERLSYYELSDEDSNAVIEVPNAVLHVEYVNPDAPTNDASVIIIDRQTNVPVKSRIAKPPVTDSRNGLNRIAVPLRDYELIVGQPYQLRVAGAKRTFLFNFKIKSDKAPIDREK